MSERDSSSPYINAATEQRIGEIKEESLQKSQSSLKWTIAATSVSMLMAALPKVASWLMDYLPDFLDGTVAPGIGFVASLLAAVLAYKGKTHGATAVIAAEAMPAQPDKNAKIKELFRKT